MNKRDRIVGESRIKVRNADTEPGRWRTYLLMSVCVTLLISGFFFAGRQHFSSMDYGMKNSKLRNQIAQLEAEKLRLIHAREVSLSPGEIRKAAKKAGIFSTPVETSLAQATPTEKAPLAIQTTSKEPRPSSPDMKPLIIKTAVVSAAKPEIQTAVMKATKPQQTVRKTAVAAE